MTSRAPVPRPSRPQAVPPLAPQAQIAARWGRWGLGVVLADMIGLGALAADEALDIAREILGGNAARLYGLPWPPAR